MYVEEAVVPNRLGTDHIHQRTTSGLAEQTAHHSVSVFSALRLPQASTNNSHAQAWLNEERIVKYWKIL